VNLRRTVWWVVFLVLCGGFVFFTVVAGVFYVGVLDGVGTLLDNADFDTGGAWRSNNKVGQQDPWAFCNALWHCSAFLGHFLLFALLSSWALIAILAGSLIYAKRRARRSNQGPQATSQ
jgi:hypothetical protein